MACFCAHKHRQEGPNDRITDNMLCQIGDILLAVKDANLSFTTNLWLDLLNAPVPDLQGLIPGNMPSPSSLYMQDSCACLPELEPLVRHAPVSLDEQGTLLLPSSAGPLSGQHTPRSSLRAENM